VIDPTRLTAADLMEAPDSLLVYRTKEDGAIEPFVVIDGTGRVFGFNGHVDLGTGIRTALTQIVAEELDVPCEQVTMILGDTARTPDQGATIASDTIQTTAVPLRAAAAQARRHLIALAGTRGVPCGKLLLGRRERLVLDLQTPVKSPADYKIVGTSSPRVDIPAKATGELTFVHDLRLPDMLHGRVVRPPYAGVDVGDFVGNSLIRVDHDSIAHIRGVVQVVAIGDFVGVVTIREEDAVAAATALRIEWKPTPAPRNLDDLPNALRRNPSQPRRLQDKGDVERAFSAAAIRMPRTYVWPYQLHASIGPSCAVAEWSDTGLRAWCGTQNPHSLRADLALLLDLPLERIDLVRMEAAGCYGRNCADDVVADAALLSRAVGRPVRVQLSREQEHLWEPKGAAQLMEVSGALDEKGGAVSYDFQTRYPSNGARTLALLLTGKVPATADVWQMGDRTSIAPYDFPNMRVTVHDMSPIVRASWLRGVSALPNSFAHESWIDEAATMAGVDPVQYRLRYLTDPRGVAVIEATAERSGWRAHAAPGSLGREGDLRCGKGFAYALYVHSKFPGYGAAWAAWVADVTVNVRTGDVVVSKVTVGHDAGLLINPDGVRHQIHGNVIQSTSRALKEAVSFEPTGITATEWGSYPILTFPEVPEIDVLLMPRPDQPPRGAGESASVPSAAAIANAIYDATGVRFREPPFTPEKILAGLRARDSATTPASERSERSEARSPLRNIWSRFLSFGAGALALAVTTIPWRAEMPPIQRPDPATYSSATIERGRQLAAIGDCAVCHTAPDGVPNAGGHRIETPFGALYSSNITPDVETGIGAWSYPAFERAMREGIHRDGRHLYPAFPYTAFSKVSDADLGSLYAYLMSADPVRAPAPANTLAFPFSFRPLMAGWNFLFHRSRAFQEDSRRSAEWNRGAYLVEGLGHCAACHSPRNAFGAEKGGAGHLSGGAVDGWDAPALTASNPGPLPWTAADYYDYLRAGRSPRHGSAGGPMTAVVEELQQVPDADIRAMATYLASMNARNGNPSDSRLPATDGRPVAFEAGESVRDGGAAIILTRTAMLGQSAGAAARLYEGACAACHEAELAAGQLAAVPLAVSTKVHATGPANFIRVVLNGTPAAHGGEGLSMAGFRASLTDRQIADLTAYVRSRFAPDRQPWVDVVPEVARLR
jgi:nicotinate dehydrogenase subunit B